MKDKTLYNKIAKIDETRKLIQRSRELHKKLSDFRNIWTKRDERELLYIDGELAKQFETGSWLNGRGVKLGNKQHYFIEFDWAISDDAGRFSSEADLTSAQADQLRKQLEQREQEEQDIQNIEVYVRKTYHQTLSELLSELREAFQDDTFAEEASQ